MALLGTLTVAVAAPLHPTAAASFPGMVFVGKVASGWVSTGTLQGQSAASSAGKLMPAGKAGGRAFSSGFSSAFG